MSRFTTAFLITVIASSSLIAESGQDQHPPAIQGEVLDAGTQRPIDNATITLLENGRQHDATTSGTEGIFDFAQSQEGVYQLLVEAENYQPAVSGEIRVVRDKTAILIVELQRLTLSETVVVTPSATSNDPRAPVTTTNYNREEIRRTPGSAGDVLRALDSLPGVASTGQFASFSVRGRGPRDNLILVDGIPFEKVVHFDQTIGEQEDLDGGGRFSIFAPNLIQSVEFQPGGFPAAYGGKNGSLLQLEVAEGNPVTPSFSGRLDLAGWEFNYDGPTYAFDNTAVLFSARAQNFGRLFKLIGAESIGSPSLEDVIIKTTTDVNDQHRVNILGIYAPERYVRTIDNVVKSENFENTFLANTSQDSSLVGVNWRWLTSQSSFLTNTFFYRNSDKRSIQGDSFPDFTSTTELRTEDIATRPNIFDVGEGEREYGWRSDFSYVTTTNDRFSAGARVTQVAVDYDIALNGELIRHVYDRNDFRPDPRQRFIVLKPEFVNSTFTNDALRTALYGDYAWDLGNRVTLTPGLRWEHDGFADQSLSSPRTSMSINLDAVTRLTVGGGIFYQHPQFIQLARSPLNALLQNERSRQITAGIQRTLRTDLQLSAEGYYQALDKLVVRADRTTGVSANTGEGYTSGVDLLLSKRLIDQWYGQVTYSYQRSVRDDKLGEGRYASDFNRPHILNTLVAYEFNDSWSLAGKWRIASGRPTDAFVIHSNVFNNPALLRYSKEITARNVDRLPAFHTLNLRLDYRKRIGRLSVITFLDIINLYGHENIDARQFQDRTGINVEEGLGAFPTFGAKFEF